MHVEIIKFTNLLENVPISTATCCRMTFWSAMDHIEEGGPIMK